MIQSSLISGKRYLLKMLFSMWQMFLNLLTKKKKKNILGEFAVIWPRPLFGVNHEICLCVDSSQSLDVSTTVISTSVKCSCVSITSCKYLDVSTTIISTSVRCSCVSITSCKYLLIILEPSFNKL